MLLVSQLAVGGAERQLVELALGLDRRRFETTVCTLYPGPLDGEISQSDVRLICLERRGKLDFTTLFKLTRLLRSEEFDVIQPFLTPATFFGLLGARFAGTPVRVATERGGVRSKAGQRTFHPYEIAEYRLMRFATVVVPNSGSGRADLIARGVRPEKVHVVYNGVNAKRVTVQPGEADNVRRQLGIPLDAPVAGMVARLEPMKDHATFLRAAALVHTALPEARFVLVGDGSLRSACEELAAELGLAHSAIFAGRDVRVAPYIDAFDIAVLSSKEAEGCSNVLLEAMGMAKPIVCTDAGGNAELVTNAKQGFVVPKQDATSLADAMLRLLRDPTLARSMGQRGREDFLERYTVDCMVRSYEDLYSQLAQQTLQSGAHAAVSMREEALR
jgi:glycosyltransferase involved in cell wall biosynthesis